MDNLPKNTNDSKHFSWETNENLTNLDKSTDKKQQKSNIEYTTDKVIDNIQQQNNTNNKNNNFKTINNVNENKSQETDKIIQVNRNDFIPKDFKKNNSDSNSISKTNSISNTNIISNNNDVNGNHSNGTNTNTNTNNMNNSNTNTNNANNKPNNNKNNYYSKNKDNSESKDIDSKGSNGDNNNNNLTATISSNNNDNNNVEEKIVIGMNDKKREVYISNECRYQNTLILGTKGTGKTTKVLPFLVEQDLQNKECGVTIITTKHDMAYNIYTLAKKYKREVVILKPSINNEISNKLLWKQEYNYDYINEYIINYKEAIKKKQIIIIDMEILKYKSEGLRAVAMLLLQLQLDIQETDITQRKPHFMYIDDAYYYLPFLEHLLNFSDDYNLGLTLLMQSRNQLFRNGKNYSYLIDNMVRNILLLNSLTKDDVTYYSSKIFQQENLNLSNFYDRKTNSFIYETIDNSYKRRIGVANYETLLINDWDEIIEKSKKSRTRLLKQKRIETERKILATIKDKLTLKSDDSLIDNLDGDELSPEQEEINNTTDELLRQVPIESLIIEDNSTSEPTPIDLSIIDEVSPLTTIPYKNNNNIVENTINEIEREKFQKIKQEQLKKIVILQEKEAKRKVSTNNFNKMKLEINYCNDDFDFTFE